MTEGKLTTKIINKETLEQCQMWQMPDVGTGQSTTKRPTLFTNEVDAIRQQAYKEGQEQGFREAYAAKEAELTGKVAELQMFLEVLKAPSSILTDIIDQQIFSVIEIMVQQIVQHELSLKPDAIKNIYEELKSQLPILHESIELQFNPEDMEVLQKLLAEHQVQSGEKISSLDTLMRGEAILKSEHTVLDATIKGRIVALTEKMIRDNQA